jgi:hypothetical protein
MRSGNKGVLGGGGGGVVFHEELVPLKGEEPGVRTSPANGAGSSSAASSLSSGRPNRHASRTRTNKYTEVGRGRRASWWWWCCCGGRFCTAAWGAIGASVIALALCGWSLLSTFRSGGTGNGNGNGGLRRIPWFRSGSGSFTPDASGGGGAAANSANGLYDELGRFVVESYDAKPPFADFLPGVAGYYGKPLYAFYVNRGQGIASFGFESKDYPIMEFNPANKAYQLTPFVGFRTFVQATRPNTRSRTKGPFVYEPFSPASTRHLDHDPQQLAYSLSSGATSSSSALLPTRYMYVGSNEMQIREVHEGHGIETNVTFFMLPEEDFGAFVKRTTITNLDAHAPITVSVVDGLAKIEPAGGKLDDYLKSMGRTLEAWMGVYQPYNDTTSMPFYRLSMLPGDTASVVVQKAGHWCLSVLESADDGDGGDPGFLPILSDVSKVFGDDTTLVTPVNLFRKPLADILQEPQYSRAKTASAFAALADLTLKPGQSVTISTVFGKADDILQVPVYLRRLTQPGFVEYKLRRSREVVSQISSTVSTSTSSRLFDGHVQQAFLDNSLRGGVPTVLGEFDDNVRMMSADEDSRLKVFHLFSRIHGDLERDYNSFVIAPTFFSQVRTATRRPRRRPPLNLDSRLVLTIRLKSLSRGRGTFATWRKIEGTM